MSNRYKGGIISATPPTTTGGETGVASGAWTLEQQMQAQAAGLWPIQPPPLYIEDVFSTWLYTGNGVASQSINNGINLTGKGGMTWVKVRNDALGGVIFDTIRGNNQAILPNATSAQVNLTTWSPSTAETFTFGSSGFSVSKGANVYPGGYVNGSSSYNYASWTFREQPKFFDIVTWTGNGSTQTINHNLGAAPAVVIIKKTSAVSDWYYMHLSLIHI